MRKLLSICVVAAFASSLFAQEEQGPKPSPESQKYALFRTQGTLPSYGLAKVQAMVKKLKEDENMDRVMPAQQYNSLSLKEKFTYIMIHGEYFSQNCDMMPVVLDEHKKIFAYFPGNFDDAAAWSQRQIDFLHKNRTQLLPLLKDTINSKKRVGNNLKHAIMEMNAVELIPTLIETYKRDRKDHDILTVLMLLMKENKFKGFMNMPLYTKLYTGENSWKSYVELSKSNEENITGRAAAYYKTRPRK